MERKTTDRADAATARLAAGLGAVWEGREDELVEALANVRESRAVLAASLPECAGPSLAVRQ